MHKFLEFIFGIKLYTFRTVPLSIIRSFSLYTQQWYMSYRLQLQLASRIRTELVQSWFCWQAVSKPVWHIPLLCVQWKIPDAGHRNCPKHVEFYSKNKFEKLVHLASFIIRIYHDARSPERHIRTKCSLSTEPSFHCVFQDFSWYKLLGYPRCAVPQYLRLIVIRASGCRIVVTLFAWRPVWTQDLFLSLNH